MMNLFQYNNISQLSRHAQSMLSNGSSWLSARAGAASQRVTGRRLALEPLEPRLTLAAAGLVDVGTQSVGALSGKIVYTHGGHGITADNLGSGAWSFQRPLLLDMIEDLGNQDQMTFFADNLFRAGATVVPLRPVGHQPNEVVLDNDDSEVTYSGAWSDSGANIYFGGAGDVPYRYASTSATETAYARYRPNVPEAGFYPVYAWTRSGSDRASDQLYRVNHSGGVTEVTVNHRRVGNGLVYLGTYHFKAGTDGYVDISNRSSDAGKVVVADMIRFGNGRGDIDRGGGVSGRDREDEAGLYWVQWHVDRSQGIATSEYRTASKDRDATVSLSPRYAEYMNREADGTLSDRLFISFHSNAGGGRGAVGLHNTSHGGDTPNQLFLADTLGREVNTDLQAIGSPPLEHDWSTRTSHTFESASFNYGEINNSYIQNEFDATIVETAFHDNQEDAELMRDAKVRDAIARATTQGVVKYFNQVDGGATPLAFAPGQVAGMRAETAGSGSVTVSWTSPTANTYVGDAATGYRIYGSTNGYGFDGGTYVAGGATTSYTYSGLEASEGVYYFKVAAVNAGGESPAAEVVAALPGAGEKDILIVSGFDRLDRTQNPLQSGAQRVRPRQSNSFDYSVQVASAIEAVAPDLVVDTAANEAVISGEVNLTDYPAVVWILGEESSADNTFDATEQALVSTYLAEGGKLFVSGSEIGWDLDNLNNGRTFYNNLLHADYLADDANTYDVGGVTGSIFDGLSFSFDDGTQFYDANFPDVIAPLGGATAALAYQGGSGGTAAIQYDGGAGQAQVVMLAFPFETITDPAVQTAVMGNVLDYFGFATSGQTVEWILDNDDGLPVYTETGSWSTSTGVGYNGSTYRFAPAEAEATAQWQFNAPFEGQGEVFVQFRSGSNRASDTRYRIDTGSGVQTVSISQTLPSSDLQWISLGSYSFTPGSHTVVLDAQASSGGSVVIADAVRIVLSSEIPTSADFDVDLDIDGRDFLTWQRGFGIASGALTTDGDADHDDDVDADDLQVWQSSFGITSTQAATETETLVALIAEASPISAEDDTSDLRPEGELSILTASLTANRRELTGIMSHQGVVSPRFTGMLQPTRSQSTVGSLASVQAAWRQWSDASMGSPILVSPVSVGWAPGRLRLEQVEISPQEIPRQASRPRESRLLQPDRMLREEQLSDLAAVDHWFALLASGNTNL